MQYRRFGDRIVARIDRGEEIVASLARLCAAEEVELASVTAIGAVNAFKVGVFSPVGKVYRSNAFSGDYEIVSLSGSVTAKDGAPYIHLHASFADASGRVFGGHLNEAFVSATCEMFVDTVPGSVGRTFSEDVGLNLFEF